MVGTFWRSVFLSAFLQNFFLCQDRLSGDVPPHLGQPCCVDLESRLVSRLVWGLCQLGSYKWCNQCNLYHILKKQWLGEGSFRIEALTLIHNISENRLRHTRGPVHFTLNPWHLCNEYGIVNQNRENLECSQVYKRLEQFQCSNIKMRVNIDPDLDHSCSLISGF